MGAAAGTVRQPTHEHRTATDGAATWSITEHVSAPDLSIHVG